MRTAFTRALMGVDNISVPLVDGGGQGRRYSAGGGSGVSPQNSGERRAPEDNYDGKIPEDNNIFMARAGDKCAPWERHRAPLAGMAAERRLLIQKTWLSGRHGRNSDMRMYKTSAALIRRRPLA